MPKNGTKSSGTKRKKDDEVELLIAEQQVSAVENDAPIVAFCNKKIRPLLDAVDELRHLKVMQQGIQLPTIVVVGDQSSGKSSVLESLAGISLPRGQGICTRVPLLMRLQNVATPQPADIFLQFNGKVVPTDESRISESIKLATDEIAGNGKGISNTLLTLVVRKHGVPDLTMVDLPGITRVPVKGQPDNIYEQITEMLMEHIKPEESIILNVLSATVDFSTCESIRMSQKVDITGERTLAVVTKVDRAPDGLLEKVTSDDVKVGLGYVCVRNRIGDESYEEARKTEFELFESHPLLSMIDKSIVGIPVLAQKLVQIQADILVKRLPEIVKKINLKLNSSMEELSRMPKNFANAAEATSAFLSILGAVKETLKKIILRGEFDEYPNDHKMHCSARLSEMLNSCSDQLQNHDVSDPKKNFLMDEINVLEEAIKGFHLPCFLPHSAFLVLLSKKVDLISSIPIEFVEKAWNYMESVLVDVLTRHSANYNRLQVAIRRVGLNLISKMKERSMNWVKEMMEMEKLTDYTCNPEYMVEYNKMMENQKKFMDEVVNKTSPPQVPQKIHLVGLQNLEVGHLGPYRHVVHQAFDLKMRMTAYWKIVLRRVVDSLALHLHLGMHNVVNKELEKEILSELMMGDGGIQRLFGETCSVAAKREKLSTTVKLLKESKQVVARIMDDIVTD